ncbi:MAG TPA: hypothetical protein DD716_00890 [Thiomicrospira sp.]|nr:hypothetical protein [Thiomicrospira sp.]
MKYQFISSLHKKLGLVSMLVVIMLVITGIMLNHNDRFEFNKISINSKVINDWYGIELPQIEASFNQEETWVSLFSQTLYINQTPLKQLTIEQLFGFQKTSFGLIIATNQGLILTTKEAELIDVIKPDLNIKLVYLEDSQLIIQKTDNLLYTIKPPYEELSLYKEEKGNRQPILQASLPLSMQKIIEQDRNNGLTVERVLLDMHSGRFFGSLGTYVIDLFSIFFLILSLTGFWMYFKARRKRRKKKH